MIITKFIDNKSNKVLHESEKFDFIKKPLNKTVLYKGKTYYICTYEVLRKKSGSNWTQNITIEEATNGEK